MFARASRRQQREKPLHHGWCRGRNSTGQGPQQRAHAQMERQRLENYRPSACRAWPGGLLLCCALAAPAATLQPTGPDAHHANHAHHRRTSTSPGRARPARLCTHHGQSARRPYLAGARGQAPRRGHGGQHLRQPPAVFAHGGLRQLPPHLGQRLRPAAAGGLRHSVCPARERPLPRAPAVQGAARSCAGRYFGGRVPPRFSPASAPS